MRKNVSGQKIGAQMVSAADGTAFTGSVTVYVTGDAGTQAAGSVGSGACTHKGNGYHTYAPAQGETNYDMVAFTFVGTGAIPATVQVFTDFPQTGDSYARLGAPAGASIAADLATIDDFLDTEVAAIKAKTDGLPADPADASDIAASFSSVSGTLTTIAGYLDTEIAAIKAKTDNLPSDPADHSVIIAATDAVMTRLGAPAGASIAADIAGIPGGGGGLDAAGVRAAVGLASANLDTQLTGVMSRLGTPAGASMSADVAAAKADTSAIKVKTDSLTFTQAGHVDANVQRINDVSITGNGAPGTEFGV